MKTTNVLQIVIYKKISLPTKMSIFVDKLPTSGKNCQMASFILHSNISTSFLFHTAEIKHQDYLTRQKTTKSQEEEKKHSYRKRNLKI